MERARRGPLGPAEAGWPGHLPLRNMRRRNAPDRLGGLLGMPARASAEWTGDLKSGQGTFTAGEGIGGSYSFSSRFEDGPGANPEQLIAAAHASCFSMALAAALGNAGTPADYVRTDATVTLRNVDGAPTITAIALQTEASVPGVDQDAFQQAAEQAKQGCPVSRALAGVPEIILEASLS